MVGLGRLELPTSPLSERSAITHKAYSKGISEVLDIFVPAMFPPFLLRGFFCIDPPLSRVRSRN